MSATPAPRRLQVGDDGQVVLPPDLRQRLGLKRGDSVAAVETPDGLLLTSEASLADRDFEQVDAELRKQRLSLDELIESGREIRGELLKEMYGRDDWPVRRCPHSPQPRFPDSSPLPDRNRRTCRSPGPLDLTQTARPSGRFENRWR